MTVAPAYIYHATLIRVVDGDTLWLHTDLGERTYRDDSYRLYGINAPEMNTDAGKVAKQFMIDTLAKATGPFTIQTFKDPEKYGRWLCIVLIDTADGQVNINDLMVSSGNAVPYFP